MSPTTPPKLLEVIVSNLQDAIEAQEGGADRLEVVRDLDEGGLTPDLELVSQIAAAVKIPLRIMLRESNSMTLSGQAEREILYRKAAELSSLNVDGLVAGFIINQEVDLVTMRGIAAAAGRLKLTFHRAFDCLPNPLQAIQDLKTLPQVDRILTTGGPGAWPQRRMRLHQWQRWAEPQITILAGAGLVQQALTGLQRDCRIREMHIGRAARVPQENNGRVSRVQVAQLKGSSA